ncbi:MAG TPA: glutamine-hydrolyzing carbamoyl-phosphate synthase small subunit [Candidatus Saccharimonadales bacterium]|nr:glutamine-hydrolyzing carbamoyl-phosphate synthase small subunit [Candidatus Saccharimonadales bacterium]
MSRLIKKSKVVDKGRPSGDFLKSEEAYLVLEDGMKFAGKVPVWQSDSAAGEVVFNTGMTGYVESLTDPSYSEQILTFTYPLIGNYGVPGEPWESGKIYAKGAVVSEDIEAWSHPLSRESLLQWLKEQNVPLIYDVDTRQLTRHLRAKGVVNGVITSGSTPIASFEPKKPLVSIDKPELHKVPGAKKTVILLDCGAKENIQRSLLHRKLNVLRVPYDYDLGKEKYDGVVLSNGPGNPSDYIKAIETVKKLIKGDRPVFGICLGSQLMSLAAGAKTYKLKFGHRGHNQPCMDMTTGKCYITSQNHGYAVDKATMPKGWDVYFLNLNDGSVEGIIHKSKPFFSVQFHPEAAPGPTDTEFLFEKFTELL